MICKKCGSEMQEVSSLFKHSKGKSGVTILKYFCSKCRAYRSVDGEDIGLMKRERIEELGRKEIEKHLAVYPEHKADFNEKNKELLYSIRSKYEDFINEGDIISTHLLQSVIIDIANTAREVVTNHIRHKFQMTRQGIDKDSNKHLDQYKRNWKG